MCRDNCRQLRRHTFAYIRDSMRISDNDLIVRQLASVWGLPSGDWGRPIETDGSRCTTDGCHRHRRRRSSRTTATATAALLHATCSTNRPCTKGQASTQPASQPASQSASQSAKNLVCFTHTASKNALAVLLSIV